MSDIPLPTPPSEPLLTAGAVAAIANVLTGLLVSFGVPLSKDQTGLIVTAVGLLSTVALAAWGRSRVYSPKSVARLQAQATHQPPETPSAPKTADPPPPPLLPSTS